MPSKVLSSAIVDLDAQIIEVEVDVSFGLRSFNKLRTMSQQFIKV